MSLISRHTLSLIVEMHSWMFSITPHDLNLCTKFVFVYTIDCHFVNCEFIQEGKYKPLCQLRLQSY